MQICICAGVSFVFSVYSRKIAALRRLFLEENKFQKKKQFWRIQIYGGKKIEEKKIFLAVGSRPVAGVMWQVLASRWQVACGPTV